MNLYKITRSDRTGYDLYRGFVVAAEDAPSAFQMAVDTAALSGDDDFHMGARVVRIGAAADGIEAGVVLSDFRAG